MKTKIPGSPEQSCYEEKDPEGRSQKERDPKYSDFAFVEHFQVLVVGASGLEDPLGVAGLVDAVPPPQPNLQEQNITALSTVDKKLL